MDPHLKIYLHILQYPFHLSLSKTDGDILVYLLKFFYFQIQRSKDNEVKLSFWKIRNDDV